MHPGAYLSHSLLNLLCLTAPLANRDFRLARYLDLVATGRLGLTSIGEGHMRVREGRTSTVRCWSTAERGVLFARAWRYARLLRPARTHAVVNSLLTETGLNVPSVLMVDDTLNTAFRWRLEVAIESQAPGRPLSEVLTPGLIDWQPVVRRVAENLAHLHRRTGSCWGTPWLPGNEMREPRRYWRKRVRTLTQRLVHRTLLLDAPGVKSGLGKLAGKLDELPLPTPRLVHGDLSMPHIFVKQKGEETKLTLIDLDTVHFGHPAEDLAMLRIGAMPPGSFDFLLNHYAKCGGEADAKMLEALDLFEELREWEKLNSRIGQLKRDKSLKPTRARRLAREQFDIEKKIQLRMAGGHSIL